MASSMAKKALAAGLCVATLGGGLVAVTPAEAQWAGHGYGRYTYAPQYHRVARRNRGAAVAAGVVGGLALGALAAGAARPAYAAPAPAYRVAPADDECYVVRRRYVDDWGRTIVRRETVCE